ncbi:hypothetical protein H0H87_000348 [Tephrocybe sp. NHM501043]|nr:hypothetical protein H0H87_000348 [Tephrocybe sp. NHM501043]
MTHGYNSQVSWDGDTRFLTRPPRKHNRNEQTHFEHTLSEPLNVGRTHVLDSTPTLKNPPPSPVDISVDVQSGAVPVPEAASTPHQIASTASVLPTNETPKEGQAATADGSGISSHIQIPSCSLKHCSLRKDQFKKQQAAVDELFVLAQMRRHQMFISEEHAREAQAATAVKRVQAAAGDRTKVWSSKHAFWNFTREKTANLQTAHFLWRERTREAVEHRREARFLYPLVRFYMQMASIRQTFVGQDQSEVQAVLEMRADAESLYEELERRRRRRDRTFSPRPVSGRVDGVICRPQSLGRRNEGLALITDAEDARWCGKAAAARRSPPTGFAPSVLLTLPKTQKALPIPTEEHTPLTPQERRRQAIFVKSQDQRALSFKNGAELRARIFSAAEASSQLEFENQKREWEMAFRESEGRWDASFGRAQATRESDFSAGEERRRRRFRKVQERRAVEFTRTLADLDVRHRELQEELQRVCAKNERKRTEDVRTWAAKLFECLEHG